MSRLTDLEVIMALKRGCAIRLENKIRVRELLNGEKGFLYAHFYQTGFWEPFHPSISDLENNLWIIDD